ncbi:hypothetical protein MUY14_38355 [Amycolatopsis sp. FBCC-B4732]|uniref:hypothetical protein n=1 Tax=Amycolatopsis sp. FBCC-B4732 TaxID=3079339 RepID=UPI001FF29C75|nr:hypothetical protein [Amycolatopsis sp. FBCC-B4732]UOX87529.1 hypothetical protein MUY14_38355 [Amycolatopsis sp. FBCC-B4732]
MFDEFLGWLQGQLVRLGLAGLARGILGILGFGVLLSGLLGNLAIKAGFLVAGVLAVLGLLGVLLLDRSDSRRGRELDRRLLGRYCTYLKVRGEQGWTISRWEESAVLKPNGDADERIVVTAVVDSDLLDFFAIRTGPGRGQSQLSRRHVKIGVGSFEGEGLGSSQWDVTSHWLNDGRLEVIVHFAHPLRRGAIMRLVVDKKWPGKWAPLMKDGNPDTCGVTFAHPIDYIEYSVLLPVGYLVHCDPVGLQEGVDDYVVGVKTSGVEQVEARLVARSITEQQRVGMVLRLKSETNHLVRVV